MGLADIIAAVRGRQRTLVVYEPASDQMVEQLREYLAPFPLRIERRDGGEELGGYVELTNGDGSPIRTDCSDLPSPLTHEAFETHFQTVLTRIDRTTFSSYDRAQMAATSREIEDRAWRFGRGSLHAGFQRASTLGTQSRVYTDLATKELDVHAYAVPDSDVSSPDDVTLHLVEDDEIAKTWFVVYDGGGDDESKCALLAEERDPGVFRGFWTYDPGVVDRVLSHLRSEYVASASSR